MFKPLDGFYARALVAPRSIDQGITITPKAATALEKIKANDHTFLVLRDGVSFEIVRFKGGSTILPDGHGKAVVPVERGINGVAQTFGPTTVLLYEVVTPVVEDLIEEYFNYKINPHIITK